MKKPFILSGFLCNDRNLLVDQERSAEPYIHPRGDGPSVLQERQPAHRLVQNRGDDATVDVTGETLVFRLTFKGSRHLVTVALQPEPQA